MHNTVTIHILGQEYTVKTGGNTNHVQLLSRYINEKVFDVQQRGTAVTTTELVAMVMLHMADDVTQARNELDAFKRTVTEKVDQLVEHIDRSTK
ncbi:MAG: cell division protein ZapA [Deltaproteobacteria bacterium]|nr:cell division protein ZapA [Deltaproteobacteria bacterium]